MGTIADKLNLLLNTKSAIKNAIIAKGQAVADTDPFSAYANKIAAIQTGVTLPTLANPGTAADLLSGKQLIDGDGNVVNGSIASRTASNLTASGATVTVPAGHYAAQASKSVATATQATPGITVNSDGLITASATQTAGYVAAGTKSATKQLTTQAAQTITPGTANQTIASGQYLTETQTILGDANLVAENIKSGVSIFGVAGEYSSGIIEASSTRVRVSSSSLPTSWEYLGTNSDGDPIYSFSIDLGESIKTILSICARFEGTNLSGEDVTNIITLSTSLVNDGDDSIPAENFTTYKPTSSFANAFISLNSGVVTFRLEAAASQEDWQTYGSINDISGRCLFI